MHENPCALVVQFPWDYVHVLVQLHVHPLVLTLLDGLYLFCSFFGLFVMVTPRVTMAADGEQL